MANNTAIEWTDATWNPVTGCTKVSPGCANCYAETVDHRFDHDKVGKLPWAFPASRGGRGVTLHPDRLELPMHWKKPQRIFVNSMSDLFHEDVPFDFILRVFDLMRVARQHTYQVLTKRPERMYQFFRWTVENVGGHPMRVYFPMRNVWLGVSTENQHWADIRIPLLMQIPAAVRFISAEPLLGPVDLTSVGPLGQNVLTGEWGHYDEDTGEECFHWGQALDWVIAGGESGPKARPAHPDWFRQIRDHCQAAGVPYFFKQFGEYRPAIGATLGPRFKLLGLDANGKIVGGDTPVEDVSAFVVRTGKKAAGAVLDGREWREFPSPLVTA